LRRGREEAKEERLGRLDAKRDLSRNGRDGCGAAVSEPASRVHENPHLLVTRLVEAHLGSRATDTAIHLGDRDSSPRLSFDLVE